MQQRRGCSEAPAVLGFKLKYQSKVEIEGTIYCKRFNQLGCVPVQQKFVAEALIIFSFGFCHTFARCEKFQNVGLSQNSQSNDPMNNTDIWPHVITYTVEINYFIQSFLSFFTLLKNKLHSLGFGICGHFLYNK